jgi:hypothetical protein
VLQQLIIVLLDKMDELCPWVVVVAADFSSLPF